MATISLVGSEDSRCMGAAFRLKMAYQDGTTHVVFERGGLPSNSRYRERITPTRSVKVKKATTDEEADGREELDQTAGKRKGMCCTEGRPTQRLKRVFNRAAQVGPPRYRCEYLQCLWAAGSVGPMKTTRPGSLSECRTTKVEPQY